jgi:hypothetical protein
MRVRGRAEAWLRGRYCDPGPWPRYLRRARPHVEITPAEAFDRFLNQRLFDSLGMKDTGSRCFPIAPRASSPSIGARGTDWRECSGTAT